MSDSGDDKPNQRPVSPPDFSHEALAHLQVQSDAFALHVENYLKNSADSNRETLKDDLQRFRNTLVLLEKGAAVYVAEELLKLLAADAAGDVKNRSELGRVLITAADQLSEHVERLQRDSSLENALSLLPLVNDSRALREESLLSDVLVLAAGIELPDAIAASVSDEHWQEQRVEWVEYATEQHPQLAKKILEWWKEDDLDTVLDLSPQLRLFTEFCRSRKYLSVLVPLYQSASIVAEALAKQEIVDGPALRKLFAQLERHMHTCILVAAPEDLLPGDLLRNFLYYVGQVDSTSPTAIELRRRFRLDRVKQSPKTAHHSTPTIGIGYHLAKAIRDSIGTETQALRDWLDQAPTRLDRPNVVRLKVRLTQLEPVLTLMGIPDALRCLQQINKDLSSLNDDAVLDSDTRHRLAESLLLMDAILDKSARTSVSRTTGNVEPTVTAEDVFVDSATDACLREARLGLQQVAESLESLLKAGVLPTGRCHAINQQIQLVDSALQILPLPEISPLLQGLMGVLTRLQLSGREEGGNVTRDATVQEAIATMLVSLDYYLGCVLQPQAAASELLLDAEESLHRALDCLDGDMPKASPKLSEKEWEKRISSLLPHMDRVGAAIASYRKDASASAYVEVAQALSEFENSTLDQSGTPIYLLADASQHWFAHNTKATQELSASDLDTLDEMHAVLPQLFDQMLSGTDDVREFDELIERLQKPSINIEPSEESQERELTLNVDDNLLSNVLDESETSGFDETLRHVFYHECLSHLEALDESVRLAVDAGDNVSRLLPSEQMLRALHTLTGSAQTVDAPHIVGIVQPLQRVALARQRVGEYFDEAETSFVGDLVVALRARLESLGTDGVVGQSVLAIENKLEDFLAASIPGAKAKESGLGSVSRGRSLDDVFDEEADELLERLRLIVNNEQHELQNTYDALAILHTLKGSARMAGRTKIAEHAHALESEIQELQETDAQADALHSGYSELNQLLTQVGVQQLSDEVATESQTERIGSAASSDASLVSDSAFDTLLDLATDVTVNQARLSDELARLREVYQDIESIANRFRELPQATAVRSTAEVNEISADLEAARSVMRQSLRQAEREQQQASRASAGLQQNLIRTRLVRVDELFDRLSQTVTDTAQSTGRIARLRIEGGEVTLDRALYRQLLAPLQHLARNAVVHGIETPEERTNSGKAASGDLLLSATVDGTDLVLRFSDDGRGIERQVLSEKLKERGESALNSHAELQQRLFQSGFSTIETPSALAGHGLGLSAVKSAVESLGGRIQFATEPGSGTYLTLRLPQRIVVNQVVLAESEGVLFALPVNFVDAVRVAAGTPGSIPKRYRRASLSALVSQGSGRSNKNQKQQRSAVLVTASGVSMALEVEKVIGYRELVTQALGPQLASLQRYSGGSVLSDGRQVLILDLQRILENVSVEVLQGVKPARESLRPVALIVDDSLTMRVAAESILQQCGIATRLTRDGVEALDSMAAALPNLVLLDLEMPRLDGKAFLKRAKEEYGDACPAVIVISSRDHPENREQLMKMGATRFLTKPYTQSQLQEAIEAAGLRLPDITIA